MTDLPEEFKKQMQAQLGPAFDDFLRSLQDPPPVSIRYNPRKRKPTDGIPVPWCSMARYLDHRPSFTRDPLFQAGAYYVQEASSMLLEQAMTQATNLGSPLTVLDLCAAPGGKSTHLLSLLSPESLLISNEVIRNRTGILSANLEKWGYANFILTQNDPTDFSSLDSFFDVIVVDAPCSGEGLFRKEPDAMGTWSSRNVSLCASRQRRIVADVWNALKPGGVLIYSTCTYNQQENHENLLWMKDHAACTFEKINLDSTWGVATIDTPGCLGYQCFPHLVRGEGFFISVIRKAGEPRTASMRSRKRLQAPASADAETVKSWIQNPEDFFYFVHRDEIRMLPIGHETTFLYLLEHLQVILAGTGLGEVKKNKIVPSHALGLSVYRNRNQFPGIPVSTEQALAYLRMEPLGFIDQPPGFRVIEFEGLGLGWVNILTGRINSLYPPALRVRMAD